jgi:hypothetical protein
VQSRDGTFRFTARAHDLSNKFLLTRRRSRVVAAALGVQGRAVSERDLLHGSHSILSALGMRNISVTGYGTAPPFCSPGEQDARVLIPEDDDGCSDVFVFAPHHHLPSRGGIAAVRYCWPPLHADAAASAEPQELRFIWLSHSPIEKNWALWRSRPASHTATCSSDAIGCESSRVLFARTIEPHDVFAADLQPPVSGAAVHIASTSARAIKWLHDNTPFWIHGGASGLLAASAALHPPHSHDLFDSCCSQGPLPLKSRTQFHALQPPNHARAAATARSWSLLVMRKTLSPSHTSTSCTRFPPRFHMQFLDGCPSISALA